MPYRRNGHRSTAEQLRPALSPNNQFRNEGGPISLEQAPTRPGVRMATSDRRKRHPGLRARTTHWLQHHSGKMALASFMVGMLCMVLILTNLEEDLWTRTKRLVR